ncbi:MAG: M48 family metalloprotease, partial [Acidobacteriota bacterium]
MTDDTGLNLFQQQEANRRRTVWLVIAFVLFFAWLGFGGDFAYWLATSDAPPDTYHHTFPWFGLIMTAIGAGIARYGFATGPNKVLWSTGAVEVVDPKTDKERQLVNVVEEMAIAAGIPRPRIWIVPDADPNAFATGLDQGHAHIAVTQGLLDICSRDELQAVVAHELGHVKNLDVRLMTTLAALVGAVALMHDGVGRLLSSGGRIGGERGGGRGKGGGALVIVVLVVWVISWILAPIIAQFLAMAVSRKREYLADAMAAQFTRNPMALASALTKIEAAEAPTASI